MYTDQGGFPTYAVKDPIGWALRFLNHFGFAEKNGTDWRVKSVGDICDRLRDLATIAI